MSIMNKDPLETDIKEVAKLIDINKDACTFYKEAKDKVETNGLQNKFQELCDLHSGVVNKLQSELMAKGANQKDVEASETVAGKANRYFGELLAALTPDADEKFIARLEEAEDRCLHSMQDAVTNPDISTDIKPCLRGQLVDLQKSHDYMKSLKELRVA